MDYIKAFIVGGIICALVQILMEKTKMLPGRIMVLLVCTGVFLSAIGIYEPFQEVCGELTVVQKSDFVNKICKQKTIPLKSIWF